MGWSDYSHSDCITVLNAYKVKNINNSKKKNGNLILMKKRLKKKLIDNNNNNNRVFIITIIIIVIYVFLFQSSCRVDHLLLHCNTPDHFWTSSMQDLALVTGLSMWFWLFTEHPFNSQQSILNKFNWKLIFINKTKLNSRRTVLLPLRIHKCPAYVQLSLVSLAPKDM